ncbi:MAG TPA: hypothetical protein DCY07_04335 [Rhodospirillaceae bacterium]|nr:hypothetical protein [Rhodospirillaceae bacterium]
MKKHTRESLAQDYSKMGLERGDIVLVRSALSAIGHTNLQNKSDHINAILDAIGDEGTLVGLAFSKSFALIIGNPPKEFTFDDTVPAITGGFANLMLQHPGRQRSRHPTNSFVAIGRHAADILEGHDETSHSYYPMEKLIGLDAKMLLVGCTETSPGFTTAHLAEYNLGLLKKIKFPWIHRVFYKKDGMLKLFKRTEIGGDSKTFYKFYPLYREQNLLKVGHVGDAESYLIKCREAYDIEYARLKNDPKFCICDDKDCFVCCGRNTDNIRNWPQFYARRGGKVIKKLLNI